MAMGWLVTSLSVREHQRVGQAWGSVTLVLSHQWVPLGESLIICLGLKKGAVRFPPWCVEALKKQLALHWGSSPPASLLNYSPWKSALSWTAPDTTKRWSPISGPDSGLACLSYPVSTH